MHDPPVPSLSTTLPGITKPGKQPVGRTRLYALLATGALLLIAAVVIRPTTAISGAGPAVGQAAPRLTLFPICETRTGNEPLVMTVSRDRKGKVKTVAEVFPVLSVTFEQCQVSVVHFWGTWCGPCRDELPELAEMYCELEGNPEFQFFSISCPAFDDPSLATLEARTRQFYKTNGVHLPTFADPVQTVRSQFLQMMQRSTMAYPTTILIDRDGVIRATWVGIPPGGAETIRRRVISLLDE